MAVKYSDASDSQKEFYYYLGLLSTKFSIMEYNVLQLLGKLIIDDFALTGTILERNTLSQNIDLLKKINKYRRYEEKSMTKLIESISNVKRYRNLFIHGVWSDPTEFEKDLMITCSEPKILYEETEHGRSWSQRKHHPFVLSFVKKQVQGIDDIIFAQNYLIKKLEENPI